MDVQIVWQEPNVTHGHWALVRSLLTNYVTAREKECSLMEESLYRELIEETIRQVDIRLKMAQERLWEYDGDDPVKSLVLTERQRGTMEGRIETWEFLTRLVPDIVTLVEKRFEDATKQKKN